MEDYALIYMVAENTNFDLGQYISSSKIEVDVFNTIHTIDYERYTVNVKTFKCDTYSCITEFKYMRKDCDNIEMRAIKELALKVLREHYHMDISDLNSVIYSQECNDGRFKISGFLGVDQHEEFALRLNKNLEPIRLSILKH